MPGLLGKKLGMTSIFTEDGENIPVTVVEVGPCEVFAIRSKENDGYQAVQLGFGKKKEKQVNKAQLEYCKKNNLEPVYTLREFRNFEEVLNVGDKLTVDSVFAEGDKVKVTGKSIGKGFQGVVKRHGFSGVGGQTHGQHNRERAPGSIGQSSYPSRVLKGMKMAGRHGGTIHSIKNLRVVKIISEKNLIMLKGAVPGKVNSIIEINK
ncbi:MAG: 50S ribosomal protein L3 [Bacteroidetes bacterium]|nr:50S ribosomal protein L3 [Bacteroidota bacterium]